MRSVQKTIRVINHATYVAFPLHKGPLSVFMRQLKKELNRYDLQVRLFT